MIVGSLPSILGLIRGLGSRSGRRGLNHYANNAEPKAKDMESEVETPATLRCMRIIAGKICGPKVLMKTSHSKLTVPQKSMPSSRFDVQP